ncbi:hypothetical protein HY213_05790 [Candidatus Peregrinibacteria bacterium]|nr:hypothetical protein [Candidatus Peregrinibacteria bacterium]
MHRFTPFLFITLIIGLFATPANAREYRAHVISRGSSASTAFARKSARAVERDFQAQLRQRTMGSSPSASGNETTLTAAQVLERLNKAPGVCVSFKVYDAHLATAKEQTVCKEWKK